MPNGRVPVWGGTAPLGGWNIPPFTGAPRFGAPVVGDPAERARAEYNKALAEMMERGGVFGEMPTPGEAEAVRTARTAMESWYRRPEFGAPGLPPEVVEPAMRDIPWGRGRELGLEALADWQAEMEAGTALAGMEEATRAEATGRFEDLASGWEGTPPHSIPPGFEGVGEEGQRAWLKNNAYDAKLTDISGNPLTPEQAAAIASQTPYTAFRVVYLLGGGEFVSLPFQVKDLDLAIEDVATISEPTRVSAILAEATKEAVMTKQERQAEDEAAGIIREATGAFGRTLREEPFVLSDVGQWTDAYNELQRSIVDIKNVADKYGMAPEWVAKQTERLHENLPPDQKAVFESLQQQAGMYPVWEARQREAAEIEARRGEERPLGEEELRDTLSDYGITVLEDSPYISPISEAQYYRLPADIKRQLMWYLASKGLTLNDIVARGVAVGARPRWGVAQQW